jgi:hypothetical protein
MLEELVMVSCVQRELQLKTWILYLIKELREPNKKLEKGTPIRFRPISPFVHQLTALPTVILLYRRKRFQSPSDDGSLNVKKG